MQIINNFPVLWLWVQANSHFKLFGLVWFLDDRIYMMAVSLHVSLIKIEA